MKWRSNGRAAALGSPSLSLLLVAGILLLGRLGCGGGAPPPSEVEGKPLASPAPESVDLPAPALTSEPAPAPASQPVAPAADDVPASAPVPVAAGPREFRFVVTNEQIGELEPCGCAEGQYGGLPRRASLLHAWATRGERTLLADNGDLVLDASLHSQLKFETTLQAHQAMGTVALTFGETDLLLDPQTVELTALNFDTPYVSANVAPWARTHVVVPLDLGGVVTRVGITGFLDPDLVMEAAPGWQVRAPAAALQPVLAELRRTSDVVLLLAHATAARTEAILAAAGLALPDGVVIAHEAEDPIEPVPTILRGVPALAPGTQAKYLARFDVRLTDGRVHVAPRYEGIDEHIPDLPSMRALLDVYQANLEQLNIADLTPRRPYESGGVYVGPQECAKCHVSASEAWAAAKHAHAMDIIVERNHEFDPDCLRCHTTGFSFVGGYTSREATPQLAFVSCEACHGPGSNHVAKPGPGYGTVETPGFCVTCHDAPNSPHFEFAAYWSRIRHELDWERPASP